MILLVGNWEANLKEADGVEHTQSLAHVDKVIAVVNIEYRFTKRGSLQELLLPVDAELLTRSVYTGINGLYQMRSDELNVVIGFWRLHLKLFDSIQQDG